MSNLNLEIHIGYCLADVPGDAAWGEEFDLPSTHYQEGSIGRVTEFYEQKGDRIRVKLELVEGHARPDKLSPVPQRPLPITQSKPLASAERRRRRSQQAVSDNSNTNSNEGYEGNPEYDVGANEVVTERERFQRGQGAFIDGTNEQKVPVAVHNPGPMTTAGQPLSRHQKAGLDHVQAQNMAQNPILSSILDQAGHRKQRMSMGYSPEQRQELMIGDMGRKVDRNVGKVGGQFKSEYQDNWEGMEYEETKDSEDGALVECEVRFQRGRGFVEVPVSKRTLVPAEHAGASEERRYMPPTGVPIESSTRKHGKGGRAQRKEGFQGRRPGKPRHGG